MQERLKEGKPVNKRMALGLLAYWFKLNRSPYMRRSNEEIAQDMKKVNGALPSYMTAPARVKRLQGKRKRAV